MTRLLDLDRIEALAKAATPGPWVATDSDYSLEAPLCERPACAAVHRRAWTVSKRADRPGWCTDSGYSQYGLCEHDARYIAEVSPDVVLSLVAEVRRLRSKVRG